MTYDESWPPRDACQTCVSLFTLNDKTQSTVINHNQTRSTQSLRPCFQIPHLWSSVSSGRSDSCLPPFPLQTSSPCFSMRQQKAKRRHTKQPNVLCIYICQPSFPHAHATISTLNNHLFKKKEKKKKLKPNSIISANRNND